MVTLRCGINRNVRSSCIMREEVFLLVDRWLWTDFSGITFMKSSTLGSYFFGVVTLSMACIASAENTAGKGSRSEDIASHSAVPVCLSANDLKIATGQPSLVMMSSGSVHLPVWSMSGGTVGQSVAGVVGNLPGDCKAVKVEIVVTTTEPAHEAGLEDVYRVHLSKMVEGASFSVGYDMGTPVRTHVPTEPFITRTIVLSPYYEVEPGAPLYVRVQREPGDPADTFTRPTGLALVKITPVATPPVSHVVQDTPGYNSWPMMQAIGDKLVCVYSRGKAHTIGDDSRAVYARTSTDGGKSWAGETVIADTPGFGEVAVGKGLDDAGAMFLWVRRIGKGEWNHDLYRTTDGSNFTLVTTPKLEVRPVQITDVFSVPTVGLMSLWFGGTYDEKSMDHSWGTLVSKDNGMTWTQYPIETGLPKSEWPTEPAAVYVGDGKILGIARTEDGGQTTSKSQFQIYSSDYGKSWTRSKTNIGEVFCSTPSLILDAKTGLLSNYYYQRGKGIIWSRVVEPSQIIGAPLKWPAPIPVATGSKVAFDAGNVNATYIGGIHYLSYYSGKAPDTEIRVGVVPMPAAKNK
jgi:hypothetical protein